LPHTDRNTGRLSRCPDARALLPAYVEGELSSVEQCGVASHLELCAACRAEEAQYRGALGMLSAPQEPLRPNDLYAGFAAKLERYERKTLVRQRQLRWAGSFACLLLVVTASASWMAGQKSLPVGAPPAPSAISGSGDVPPVDVNSAKSVSTPKVVVRPEKPEKRFVDVPNAQSDPFVIPDDGGAAVAEESRPAPRRHRPLMPRRSNTLTARNFLEVTPKQGPDAVTQLEAAKQGAGTAGDGGTKQPQPVNGTLVTAGDHHPNVPGMTYYEKEADQRLRVGGTVTRVSRARGYNSQGDLVLVKVNIGTTNKTGTDADSSTHFSEERD
jgi:hypothetical protein